MRAGLCNKMGFGKVSEEPGSGSFVQDGAQSGAIFQLFLQPRGSVDEGFGVAIEPCFIGVVLAAAGEL